MMYQKLNGVNFLLHMINVDGMNAAKTNLPLPAPYNKIWQSVSKIIDVFHFNNHIREDCKIKYNPRLLKEVHPNFNTQVCEQTFSWLGKYSRILMSIPKTHNHFYLHRLVRRRNNYNSRCYCNGHYYQTSNNKYLLLLFQ